MEFALEAFPLETQMISNQFMLRQTRIERMATPARLTQTAGRDLYASSQAGSTELVCEAGKSSLTIASRGTRLNAAPLKRSVSSINYGKFAEQY
jgi:hypothetical protein